ncbi:hypothetical protein EOL94_04335 [bacterium]|nr:hypothetical protein [bacterium]
MDIGKLETIQQQEISKILEFVKKNFALLSFLAFAFLAILDFYIFTETFHMSGAIYYNRLLSYTLSSFGQFGLFIAIPILIIVFLLTSFYITQFLFLDTTVKITRISIVKKKIKRKNNKIIFIFIIFSLFVDSLLLLLLSKFSIIQSSVSLILIYLSLTTNNIFLISGITYYFKTKKKDTKSLGISLLKINSLYMLLKFALSIFLAYTNLEYIGFFINLNAILFVFIFSWHVLRSNKFNVLRMNQNIDKKNNYFNKPLLIIGFTIFLYLFLTFLFRQLYKEPFENNNFWRNYENNRGSLPWQSTSNIFNPAKMERINNFNFSLVQKEEINNKLNFRT